MKPGGDGDKGGLEMIDNLSYSKINTFLICPYRYKWMYLDGVFYQHNLEYHETRFVKVAIENILNNIKGIKTQSLQWYWDNIYSNILPLESMVKLEKIIADFAKNIKTQPEVILSAGQMFHVFFSEYNIRVNGKFSHIEQTEDTIRFIDYKMGDKIVDDELWNNIYGYALPEIFLAYTKFEMHRYYIELDEFVTIPIPDTQQAYDFILEKIKLIVDEKEFLPKENPLCSSCQIKSECVVNHPRIKAEA